MISNDELLLDQCRTLLKRAAWRLQYHARMQILREVPSLPNYLEYSSYFEEDTISSIFINELTDEITSEKCKYIIKRVIIEQIPEKEVASEIHISQQGVSKWKKKGIKIMHQKLMDSQTL